jgi:replicative superfamily II helicase
MDEMHALGSVFNGYLLEILISKVLYLEKRVTDFANDSQHKDLQLQNFKSNKKLSLEKVTPVRIQLIAMSATVGNVGELARWFGNVEPFVTDYRPVALFEKLVAGAECCNKKGHTILARLPIPSEKGKDKRYWCILIAFVGSVVVLLLSYV